MTHVLWDGENTHGVGVVASRPPALDGNDGVTLPDDAEVKSLLEAELDPVIDIRLPSLITGRARLVVEERVAASVEVDLPCGDLVPREREDRAARSELGDETGSVAGG